jgi:DNA (cytosine-5)-methyltransferase 1
VTHRYISVFSGAGGLDLGITRAGLAPVLLTDESRAACSVLSSQGGSANVICADVHDLLNAGTFTALAPVLVAGQPPLLDHPGTGNVEPDDDAPQLLFRFLDVVAQAKPEAFIMVTMPFVSGPRWASVMARLRRTATRDLGYDTAAPVIDASEYGVPQHKNRLFFIGMPRGCKPDATAAFRAAGKVSAGAALRAVAREIAAAKKVIRDIPCTAGVRLSARPVLRNSPYSGTLLAGPGRIIDLRKVAPVLPSALGGNKTPVLDLDQLEHDEDPWIEGYHDYLWRLHGMPGKYGSEGRMRRLTLRECAALQGLPADYPLRGAALTQFRLVGAVVPPALGEAVGRSVMAGLR